MYAAQKNAVECARWLIEQGADVDHTSYEDMLYGPYPRDMGSDYDHSNYDTRDCAVFAAVKNAVELEDTRIFTDARRRQCGHDPLRKRRRGQIRAFVGVQ